MDNTMRLMLIKAAIVNYVCGELDAANMDEVEPNNIFEIIFKMVRTDQFELTTSEHGTLIFEIEINNVTIHCEVEESEDFFQVVN